MVYVVLSFLVLTGWAITGLIGVYFIRNEKRPRFRASDIYSPKRRDVRWNKRGEWPRGDYLFYQCLNCQKAMPSQTTEETHCGCGNLFIGPEHIGAQNRAKVRLFEPL